MKNVVLKQMVILAIALAIIITKYSWLKTFKVGIAHPTAIFSVNKHNTN
ncbi:hypothetical protein [Anabaena azotica]|uniref:Uncharacterized protein n=1 Tax=Anabaena azotica FACHB-119 TaxID=947527 RepID=A0ABR8CXZ8_9NOST|nr:hypothetical protein [Anabaena azotica]MBD2499384.1 hypothetical protein [Anabaena azotica FACHB-119]